MVVSNSYSTERALDLVPHIRAFGASVLYGVFYRTFRTPFCMVQLISPDFWARWTGGKQITAESIEAGFYDSEKLYELDIPEIPKEKLQWFLERVQQIAQKMGITNKIVIYSSEENPDNACEGACLIPVISLKVAPELLNQSEEGIDHIIAHELTHAFNNDIIKVNLLSNACLIMEVAAAILFTPLVIPLIEGGYCLLEIYLARRMEMEADLNAMRVLNSSRGFLQDIEKRMEDNFKIRNTMLEKFQNNPTQFWKSDDHGFFWNIFLKIMNTLTPSTFIHCISEEGNLRFDLNHPPYSERRAVALAFQPQPA